MCRSPFKLGTRLKGVKEKESNELNQPGASCLEEPRVWSPANRTDWKVKVAQSCLTLCNPMNCSPWNSPGQNTGVGTCSLLQGYLPNLGIEPRPPTLQVNFYQLNQKGSPRILEWVAYPFPSRSSQPRNQTGVSCIAGGFFTN